LSTRTVLSPLTLVAIVTATLVAPAGPLAGQTPAPLRNFDAYVRQAVADWHVPGLSVAVVKDGEVVFAQGYGVRELGMAGAVDAETLFAIGSTTKAMTAAALGMMVDEGLLGWNDPVVDHLPWFRLADPALAAEVRVRDLLTHNVGLPNADYLWYERDVPRREVVESLRYVEATYSLRSGYIYQNIMYAAAGQLLEAVSGISWDDFIRTRIFGPIGMTGAVTTLSATRSRDNVASPHYDIDGVTEVIENASVDPVAAAGSVWAGAGDMGRWIATLLNDCVTSRGEVLLEPATCAELFTPQTLLHTDAYPTAKLTKPHWQSYGFGWFQIDYEGRKTDFHTGSIDGMVAIAGMIRDEGVGVYVLGNRDHAEVRHALMYRVFDLYDAEPARDWSVELKELYDGLAADGRTRRETRLARRVEGTSPGLPLSSYAGTYSDKLYGSVTVTEKNGELIMEAGLRTGAMTHWHHETFRVTWDAKWRGFALPTFRLGGDGTATAIVMNGVTLRRQGG